MGDESETGTRDDAMVPVGQTDARPPVETSGFAQTTDQSPTVDVVPMHVVTHQTFGGQPITERDVALIAFGAHSVAELMPNLAWLSEMHYLGKVFRQKASTPEHVAHDALAVVLRCALEMVALRDGEGKPVDRFPPPECAGDLDVMSAAIKARIHHLLSQAKPEEPHQVQPATPQDMRNVTRLAGRHKRK